ncbi:MAG TPA: hypothetical protein VL981_13180 [Candidatus Methylacidiphilales bacterium]|nr:hypothetical protein [Candidatus Methylacidiphilales bacterium]
MENIQVKPVHAPPVWKRILIWYGTVWFSGVIGGFMIPNSDNTSYKIGEISISSGSLPQTVGSFISLFINSLFSSPLTLFEGFFKVSGNYLGVSGIFLLGLGLLCIAICLGHFIFFLTVKERGVWYGSCLILGVLCLGGIAGCMMDVAPQLLPDWH